MCRLILSLAIVTLLIAQTKAAGISGSVTDPSGSVVPNAAVTLLQGGGNGKTIQLTIHAGAEQVTVSDVAVVDVDPYRTRETIANFAMGDKAITAKEATYLTFWKAWWQQYKTAIVPAGN